MCKNARHGFCAIISISLLFMPNPSFRLNSNLGVRVASWCWFFCHLWLFSQSHIVCWHHFQFFHSWHWSISWWFNWVFCLWSAFGVLCSVQHIWHFHFLHWHWSCSQTPCIFIHSIHAFISSEIQSNGTFQTLPPKSISVPNPSLASSWMVQSSVNSMQCIWNVHKCIECTLLEGTIHIGQKLLPFWAMRGTPCFCPFMFKVFRISHTLALDTMCLFKKNHGNGASTVSSMSKMVSWMLIIFHRGWNFELHQSTSDTERMSFQRSLKRSDKLSHKKSVMLMCPSCHRSVSCFQQQRKWRVNHRKQLCGTVLSCGPHIGTCASANCLSWASLWKIASALHGGLDKGFPHTLIHHCHHCQWPICCWWQWGETMEQHCNQSCGIFCFKTMTCLLVSGEKETKLWSILWRLLLCNDNTCNCFWAWCLNLHSVCSRRVQKWQHNVLLVWGSEILNGKHLFFFCKNDRIQLFCSSTLNVLKVHACVHVSRDTPKSQKIIKNQKRF